MASEVSRPVIHEVFDNYVEQTAETMKKFGKGEIGTEHVVAAQMHAAAEIRQTRWSTEKKLDRIIELLEKK